MIVANFSIDNSAPRISLNLFPRNQTNATILFNFTVTDVGNGTLSNCTLVQSGAIINSSAAGNPVPPNATTGSFVNVVAPNEYASIINCTDIARAGGQFGPFRNSNISVNVSYIIDTSSVLSNNIKIFSFYPFNLSLVRSTVIFNITIDQRVGFAKTNVSNVSFYLTNSSGGPAGGTFFIDINRSANLSAYTIANSTTFLTDGDYALNVTIVNQTGGVGSTILANFSIDNTPPTVIHNIYPVGNQTNNTLLFNFTVFDRGNATILNCTLLVDNTIVNTSNYTSVGAQFANSTEPRNSSLTFVTTERRDHTAFVRCFDTARERDFNGALGNSNESTTITFTTDINSPQFTIKFKDSNENEKTEFTYGSEVTAVCNLSDSSTGVDPRRINTSIATPGSNTQNVTSTITRTTATYVFAAESTRELGDYLFSCTGYDYASFGNATNATFKVIEAAPRSTSAFSVPGFRAPVGKVKVSPGVTSSLGVPPVEGVSRLLQKGSAVTLIVNNVEHKITIDEVLDDMVRLTITSEPVQVEINKDESKLVDVEGGTLDITFHGKYPPNGKWADITFAVSAAPAPTPDITPPTPQPTEPTSRPPAFDVAAKTPMIVIIVVIIIIVLIGFFLIRGKKK